MHRSRKHTHLAAAALALLLGGTAVPAQQLAPNAYKIGFVDGERVLRESRVSKKMQMELSAEFQKREKEIAAGPAMDIQKRSASLAEELTQRREDELKQLILKTRSIIKRLAESEKFDIVFLEASYVNARIDMTDSVIKALDAAP